MTSHSAALATIGSLLIRKVYFSDDSNMPLLYLRKAVSLNNIEGEWELAQVELREGRLDAGLQHLQRAERGGHVRATMALAQLYDNGLGGLKQSCGQAVLLYKRVAEIGPWVDHSNGPREAVKEFRRGKESSALTISLLAAMEGYEVAQYNAAWMLMRNKGMEESNICFSPKSKIDMRLRHETATALLSFLSMQQPLNAESNVMLGDIYMGGYLVPHNFNYSALHYERAADAGNALGTEDFSSAVYMSVLVLETFYNCKQYLVLPYFLSHSCLSISIPPPLSLSLYLALFFSLSLFISSALLSFISSHVTSPTVQYSGFFCDSNTTPRVLPS